MIVNPTFLLCFLFSSFCFSKNMGTYLNSAQKELMITFLTEHPQIETKKFGPDFTKQNYQDLWKQLADLLNAIPNGANKNWMKWRKTWTDIKKNSKGKAAKARKYEGGTGGGPPVDPELTECDKKILDLMSPVCLGDLEIPEPEIMLVDERNLFTDHVYEKGFNAQTETDANKENTPDSSPTYYQNKSVTDNITFSKMIPSKLSSQTGSQRDFNNLASSTISNKIASQSETKLTVCGTSSNKPSDPHPQRETIPPAEPVTPKVFRVTKTMRLNESIKNNKKFMDISEEALKDTKNYHSEKLKIIKEYYQSKQKNDERQSAALEGIQQNFERQNVALENISKSFAVIAENLAELM